jgi:uncharacterized membrane protein
MTFHEHAPRSLIKTITYRTLIIISNGLLIYGITANAKLTGEITVGASILSTILYYLHERVWNKIHWGKSHIKK